MIIVNRKVGKCCNDADQIKYNNPFAVFTLFKDNSAIIQNPNNHGRTISTIFPPPTAKEVMFI
jgi:hypothetical protein